MAYVKHRGYEAEVGNQMLTFAPFTIGVIENFGKRPDQLDASAFLDLLTLSAQRNHPEVSREFLANNLDLEEAVVIFGEVMKLSGVERAGKALARALAA